MKLEYFANGSLDCPLLLLYGAEPQPIVLFQREMNKLIQGHISQVCIHDLPGFISVDGCQLLVLLGNKDVGVRQLAAANQFECCLQAETWLQVVEPLEPFVNGNGQQDGTHFQCLDNSGPISLLISTARSW